MTKDLVPSNSPTVAPKFRLRKELYPTDTMVCFILAIGLVALLARPLADAGIMTWYWGFFMLANVCYLIHGMKKGWAKGDPGNGMAVATGPIAFYFWAFLGAWRTYYVYRKDGPGWVIKDLEKELMHANLTQGFDFDFLAQHGKRVRSYLRQQCLCVEEVLDEPFFSDGKRWDCLSITDTKENMTAREALR